MPVEDRAITAEHVIEVRYKAFGGLLDMRGRIADAIADRTELKFWNIGDNLITFRVTEGSPNEVAFVGHNRLGYAVRRPATRNYAVDRGLRFLSELLRVDGFALRPVQRVGVRLRVLIPYQGRLEALVGLVNERMPIHANAIEPFRAEVEDVGPVLVLKRGDVRIKVQSGPMAREQAATFLQGYDRLPEVGFYLDQDHYQTEHVGQMGQANVTAAVRAFSAAAWEAVNFYNGLLF